MDIWLLAENWPPRTGGIENYLTNIAAQLRSQHSVQVIAPAGEAQEDAYVWRRRFFYPLVRPKWSPLLKWLRAKDQPDLMLCGKALFEGQLASKLGVPYVLFTYAMEIKTWSQSPRLKKKLEQVIKGARAVVYINEVTRQHLVELGATDEQLLPLPPGINQRSLDAVSEPLVESTARHYGIRAPYILSVGRLIERKGFDILIEAFSQLDQTKLADYQLVIVGAGPEAASLKQVAQDHLVGTYVKFLDNVPDKHLPPLYAGADVFALTPIETENDMEGFGIVYVEAAAQGTPAIATATGGAGEAVVDESTGLVVPPGDSAAVTAALSELLMNEERRTKLGAAARDLAGKRSWPDAIEPLMKRIGSGTDA